MHKTKSHREQNPESLQSISQVTNLGADTPLLVLKGRLADKELTFLIESGASKNFVSDNLDLPWSTIPPLRVKLADGDVLVSKTGISTQFVLEEGDLTMKANLVAIPLGSFEVILGQPWLKEQNPLIN